jgi:predicted mannosyl-3-phosphoglycerate phosphatase (HAD superfamily)
VSLPSSHSVVFCSIDEIIPLSGNPLSGFPLFLDGLSDARIPCVWVSSRNRHQLDSVIRKLGHSGPFIAEGGCGTYLPEDYFHVKPPRTVRLGRFTCIPVAEPQPAAADALESLAAETGIEVVPLRSLSPRELMQNTGLPRHEAEAARQRDFDELFFFAGTSDSEIRRFRQGAEHRKLSVRRSGAFWSLAVQASLATCIQEVRKLYDRALHTHALGIAVATAESADLGKFCDRAIFLAERGAEPPVYPNKPPSMPLPLFSANTWPAALEAIQNRRFTPTP